MPSSQQARKSTIIENKIMESFGWDKEKKVVTTVDSAGVVTPVLTESTGNKKMHTLYLFNKNGVKSFGDVEDITAYKNSGVSATDREWNLKEILPENFIVKEFCFYTSDAVSASSNVTITYIDYKNTERTVSTAIPSNSKGCLINVENPLVILNHSIKTAGSSSSTYNFVPGYQIKEINSFTLTEATLPDSDTNFYYLNVRGYYV